MIRTLFFVVFAGFVVAGAVWLSDHRGEVVFSGDGWEVGVPVPLVVLAVLAFSAVVALLYRLWRGIRGAPGAVRERLRLGRRERGYRALTQGMVAVAAGDADEARRQARKADALLGEPPLTMLLSAQAAQLSGDEAAAKRYFTAMLEREETAFLGLRGLLMQAQRKGDREEALALARRARALQPKTPWVLSTLLDLQIAERRWREALETLDEAVRRKAVDAEKARRLKTVMMLGSSLAAEEAGNADDALALARKAHAQQPDFLPATIRVATLSADTGKKRAAIRAVEDAWPRTPHPALAALYGTLAGQTDPLKLVGRYEKLRSFNPDHAESHIALARAMLEARLWGGCRTHLEAVGGDAPSARICRLMAELEEGETGDMAAVRRWLVRAAEAAPDPAWICGDCGGAAAAWTPTCARCAALGTLAWKVPERALSVGRPASPAVTSGANGGIVPDAENDEPAPAPPPGGEGPESPRPAPRR